MIDLRRSELYKRAKYAQQALTDGLLWINSMNNYEIKTQIANWIRYDQLREQGVDGDGNVIGYYSYFTSLIDQSKEFNSPYTLEKTGEFYQSIFVVVLLDAILINADSQKMEDKEWWSNKILELTDENIENLRVEFKRRVQDYTRNVLLGRR